MEMKGSDSPKPAHLMAMAMANFILCVLLLLTSIAFFFEISIFDEAYSSFNFGKNVSFASNDIALYGDAKLVDGGSSIQLSHGSGGRVVYKKPIKYAETEDDFPPAVFITTFSFSMSPNQSESLGFVLFPVHGTFDHSLFQAVIHVSQMVTKSSVRLFQARIDIFENSTRFGDGVLMNTRNFTITTKLENNKRFLLYAWIHYMSHSQDKRLQVQLYESESSVSFDYAIQSEFDLKGVLKDEDEFMVGLNLYRGNFDLHSWSLEARRYPQPMVEYVLTPEGLRRETEGSREERWETVTGFAIILGSIGLVFAAMMLILAAFKWNNLVIVISEEYGIQIEKMEIARKLSQVW